MWSYHLWGCIAILFIVISRSHSCNDDEYKKPVVAALLDIHSGQNCDVVNFHGIQQLAAVKNAMKVVNKELLADEIEIDLQIFDSCSTRKGTRIATLKALVSAEQTCINTPFFLGFLGNENKTNFEVSQSITQVFNLAHVLPYAFNLPKKSLENVHYVSSYPIEQHTEAVTMLLSKLGVQNIMIVYENTDISKMKVDHLLDCFKEDLCILKTVIFVNTDNLKAQLEKESNEEAMLVIVENMDALDEMSMNLVKYEKQIIISSGKVGFENSIIRLMKKAYVMQFVSATPLGNLSKQYDEHLVKSYFDKQLQKCSRNRDRFALKCNSSVVSAGRIMDKDWTTDLLQYGLKLYGSSIRIAAYENCKQIDGSQGICSQMNSLSKNVWNDIVRGSSAFAKVKSNSINEKIHFNMNLGGKFTVYLLENGLIQKIGAIEDSRMELYNYKFSSLSRAGSYAKCVSTIPATTASTTTQTLSLDFQPEATVVPISWFFDFDIRDYEVIGFLSGIVFGILFLICLVGYFVYSTVKVKSNRSDSSFRGSIRTGSSD